MKASLTAPPLPSPARVASHDRPGAGVVLVVLVLHGLALWAWLAAPARSLPAQVLPVTLLAQSMAPADQPPAAPLPTSDERPAPPSAKAVTAPASAKPVARTTKPAAPPPQPNSAAQSAARPIAPLPAELPLTGLSTHAGTPLAAASNASTASTVPAAASNGEAPAQSASAMPAQNGQLEPEQPPASSGAFLNNPPPTYPAISRRLGEQGKVTLRAFIDPQGSAREVEVLRSSGYERLDQAAVRAARDWRYRPGMRAGKPEGMWFNLPVVFELQ